MLAKFTSDKFRFWTFVSMALLVVVHGYNLDARRLEPSTLPAEALTVTAFAEYFLANGLFRFRVGLLCLISGYLYALHDQGPNGERLTRRVRTLLVPYLLWSGLCLVLFYGLEMFPLTREWIAASGIARIHGTHLLVHDYRWDEVLIRWILIPLPYHLWFLRALFFCNLVYPLLKRWVTGSTSQRIFFSVAVFCWLGTFSFSRFEAEALLFFSLGVWVQKTGFPIDHPRPGLNPLPWGLVAVSAAAIKTWLAFAGIAIVGGGIPVLVLLHKLTIASGVIAVWFGGDALVRWSMRRPWFVWVTSFSFLIYVAHVPWIALAIDPVLRLLDHAPGHRMLTFVLLPLTVLVFTLVLGALLRSVTPRAYGVMTGGRGL